MISPSLKRPRLHVFGFIKALALAVHYRVMQRRRNRIKLLPAAPEPIEPALLPAEIEAIQVAEQVAVPPILFALAAQPLLEPVGAVDDATEPDIQPVPQNADSAEPDRLSLVLQLLDEGHGRGFKTYAQLIGYVKEQTGKGCSKRVVADWKRSRGLLDEAA